MGRKTVKHTHSQITMLKYRSITGQKSIFIEWINRKPLVKRQICLLPDSAARKMPYSGKF
jgi:hypothetical protein